MARNFHVFNYFLIEKGGKMSGLKPTGPVVSVVHVAAHLWLRRQAVMTWRKAQQESLGIF